MSYSRHAVRDSDLSSAMAPVNRNNMHFQVRRMVSETVRAEQQSKLIRRKRVNIPYSLIIFTEFITSKYDTGRAKWTSGRK